MFTKKFLFIKCESVSQCYGLTKKVQNDLHFLSF